MEFSETIACSFLYTLAHERHILRNVYYSFANINIFFKAVRGPCDEAGMLSHHPKVPLPVAPNATSARIDSVPSAQCAVCVLVFVSINRNRTRISPTLVHDITTKQSWRGMSGKQNDSHVVSSNPIVVRLSAWAISSIKMKRMTRSASSHKEKLETEPAIGIDLGTTYSCVAVVRNGKVEVIANEEGNFTTPSFVAFNEHERLIGDAAKQQVAANSANTIFDVKRLIGRSFSDPIVQADIQRWPFKVVDVDGLPKIEITYNGEMKQFSALEISAMILGRMKEVAESYLNTTVSNAVVTVPSYFNDLQRTATKSAAEIAGMTVKRILNEPTAAAIAYGLTNPSTSAQTILVFDLGGGTFDVSILKICENQYKVVASGGDTHLGGEDFDNLLMATLVTEFKRKSNVDLMGNAKALRKLRTACERAKRTLSTQMHAPIDIDSLANGIDFVTQITRARFNELCADLFRLTIKITENTLKDADLSCIDIDTIVLVGGSTRIPKIQQLLQDLFVGKEINRRINPDEAVAYGAAVQAAIIHGNADVNMEKLQLMEITPLTLGIAAIVRGSDHETMSPVIKRNTALPTFSTRLYTTLNKDQTNMAIKIIQGEHHLAEDNFKIGEFVIRGIPKAAARDEKVEITFSIDANGILNVTATSLSNCEARGTIAIENVCGNVTRAEVERMIGEAAKFREEDRTIAQYRSARSELEDYSNAIKKRFGGLDATINQKCNEILLWLKHYYSRPQIEELSQEKNELTALVSASAICKSENHDLEVVSSSSKSWLSRYPKNIDSRFE